MIDVHRPARFSTCVSCGVSVVESTVGHVEITFGGMTSITLCRNCSNQLRHKLMTAFWYEQEGREIRPIMRITPELFVEVK